MKKILVASVALALLAGCGKVQPSGFLIQSLDSSVVVRDMGFQGGRTLSLNLTVPQNGQQKLQTADAFTGWTADDIFQYDLKLSDITDADDTQDLATFSVPCKGGNAKAVFTNLKPGRKYQITVFARGNKGGTAASSTLNTVPGIGAIDLTNTPADSGAIELTTTIRIQLDGAYERIGSIGIQPLDGNTISDDAETAAGYCGDCDEDRIEGGTTTYDSTFAQGTNGDPFNADEFHQHWTNSENGSAWLQRDLDGTYAVKGIFIRHAYSDLRFAPATSIKLRLQAPDGTWTTVKQFANTNLHFYFLKLDTPVNAKAFRLEMASGNGWFSATGLALKGTAVSAGNGNGGNTGDSGNGGNSGNSGNNGNSGGNSGNGNSGNGNDHDDNGHGNDEDGVDESNPGNGGNH